MKRQAFAKSWKISHKTVNHLTILFIIFLSSNYQFSLNPQSYGTLVEKWTKLWTARRCESEISLHTIGIHNVVKLSSSNFSMHIHPVSVKATDTGASRNFEIGGGQGEIHKILCICFKQKYQQRQRVR